jgi:hypothetical protein
MFCARRGAPPGRWGNRFAGTEVSTVRTVAVVVTALAAALPFVAALADEPPIRTFTAFNATIYYRYTCVDDVFKLSLGARNQSTTGGETELYWEVWDSGALTSGQVEPVAGLSTLPVQPLETPLVDGFPKGSTFVTVPRMCTGQSLYLWPASSATPLPDGNPMVQFTKAAEQPMPLPTP